MGNDSNLQRSLVEVDDSVLVVIDVQDYFLNKYDRAKSRRLVGNVAWLFIWVCQWLPWRRTSNAPAA